MTVRDNQWRVSGTNPLATPQNNQASYDTVIEEAKAGLAQANGITLHYPYTGQRAIRPIDKWQDSRTLTRGQRVALRFSARE